MTSKRQKITEAMSLLDEEKENVSSNTYVRLADSLADFYKSVGSLYVLKWTAFIPEVRLSDDVGEDDYHVEFVRSHRSSLLVLTPGQVDRIKADITCPGHYTCFWREIALTSVGQVPHFGIIGLKFNGEDIFVRQSNAVISIVEYA